MFVSVEGNTGTNAGLNGVYKSTNGGASWAQLTGLPSSQLASGGVTGSIQMDSGSGGVLYVSMLTVGTNPPACTGAPSGVQIAQVQRFQSTDGGNTWTSLAASPGCLEQRSWHQLIAVDPQNDKHVFVNDSYSLYESVDGGMTWSEPPGEPGFDFVSVSFDKNGEVLVTSDQGLIRYCPSSTAQQTYCPASTWQSLVGNLQITTFATLTLGDPTVQAGTAQDQYAAIVNNSGGSSVGPAVWRYLGGGSETGKVLWSSRSNSPFAYVFNPLSENLVSRAPIVAATGPQPTTNWTTILTLDVYGDGNYGFAYTSQKAFVMDPFNPRRLLVGVDQVYETTNADYSTPAPYWASIGPAPKAGAQPFVTAIAIAPSASNYVYAAINDGHVWVTTNDGGAWTEVDSGLYDGLQQIGYVLGMTVDPANPQHVFAVTNQWGGTSQVWELQPASTIGQQTWSSRYGPGNLSVFTIYADWQNSPAPLYIGTDRGVFRATNPTAPASWKPFGAGLQTRRSLISKWLRRGVRQGITYWRQQPTVVEPLRFY